MKSLHIQLYLLQLCIVFLWSVSWVVGKYTLHYLSPFYLITIRLSIATFVFFVLAFLRKDLIWPSVKDLPIILFVGVFQFFLFTFLSLWGLNYIEAGNSAILSYTTPIWVTLLTYFIFKEPITKGRLFSVILGALGIVFLLSPFYLDWGNKYFLLGSFLLVLAAFSWSIAIVSSKYLTWYKKPMELVAWQFLIATLCSIPIYYVTSSSVPIEWSASLILAILFLSIIATSFGFFGMVIIAKELPSITTSLCLLGVPFFSLIISHYFLNEQITLAKSIAMISILFAIIFSIYEDNKKRLSTSNI